MERKHAEAWERFTTNMIAFSNLCFVAGCLTGSLFYFRSVLLMATAALLTLVGLLIPLQTEWVNRPNLTRHRWPKREIWKIVPTEIILGMLSSITLLTILMNREWVELPLKINYSLFILIVVIYNKGESIFVLCYHADEFCWHSYLIYHSKQYVIAHTISQAEYFVEVFFFYEWKAALNLPMVIVFTLVSVIGLTLRNLAFHQAKSNFHHLIRYGVDPEHKLITTGIYAWDRHPSYVGFYVMSLGLQILLKNPITTIGFFFVLRWFFKDRILSEEATLIEIFGESYIEYSAKVKSRVG